MSSERWRLDIAYDGTEFSGWAAQPGRRTVQGVLERWIPQVLRLDRPVALVCAGRTDAGVHARGQVAHLDVPVGTESPRLLAHRLARVLPPDVVVGGIRWVSDDFDARFAAVWRRYVYRLVDAGVVADPLLRRHVVRLGVPVDHEAMNAAAGELTGLRDFAAFCKRRDGATTIRTLLEMHAERLPSGVIATTVRADAFCHSMVRSLMGAVVAVGSGRRDVAWLRTVLASPGRDSSVQVMPAHGLCLEEVGYPADEALAERARQARAARSLPGNTAGCAEDGDE